MDHGDNPVPSVEARLCPPGLILWVAYCFQDHLQNTNPEGLGGLLEVTHLRNGDLVSSRCRPRWLSNQAMLPATESHYAGNVSYPDNGLQI